MLFVVLTPSSNVHWETAELAAVDFFEAGFLDSATAAAAAAAAMSVTRQKNRLSVWPCAHVRHRYQHDRHSLGGKKLIKKACLQDNDITLTAGVEGTQQQEGSWMPSWLKSRLPGDCQQAACYLHHVPTITD